MKINSILSVVLVSVFTFSTAYADKPVAISKADGPNSLEMGVSVGSGDVMFMRNQNNSNTVNPAFAKTSRPCPPFCVQPMQLRPGVDTIGEQEIIHYAVMMSKGEKMPDGSEIMVIDTQDGVECADSQFVTYFQGRPYDGQIHYNNIKYINKLRCFFIICFVSPTQIIITKSFFVISSA